MLLYEFKFFFYYLEENDIKEYKKKKMIKNV